MKNFSACLFIFFFITTLFGQNAFDGNSLASFLGKEASSSEIKSLQQNYHCEMVNEAHFLSKEGIELILKTGALNEINLYNNSSVYGKFTGKLPNNLRFGMGSGEIKSLLGKPVASYNNGYCEFDFPKYILSCWSEGGKLNQVGVALK